MANASRPSFSVRVGPSSGLLTFSSLNTRNTFAFTDALSGNSAAVGKEISSDAVLNGVLSSLSLMSSAAVDWKDTPAAHVIKVDVPGVRKEDVKVDVDTVEDHPHLIISGQRPAEETAEAETWYYAERRLGRFQRRFPLPENAMVDEITAALESGVLTVTVPKAEGNKNKKTKSIQILG